MDVEQALLAAIRDNPDDDLPRLALADWLLEQPGDGEQAYGEFIHLQCRLARLPAYDPTRPALDHRQRELLRRHRSAWMGPLADQGQCEFHRGLVRLTIPGGALDVLQRLAAPAQWRLSALRVMNPRPEDAATLAGWAGLASVGELDLEGGWDSSLQADGVRQLAASEALGGLACLRLHRLHLGDAGARELAGSPYTRRLVRLDLSNNGITDAGVADLAASPHLRRLADLSLADNLVRAAGAAVLAHPANLPGLVALDLGRNILGPAGAKALAAARGLLRLQQLDLRLNGVMDEGARALLSSPLVRRLRRLNLVGNGVLGDLTAELRRGGLEDRVEQ